MPKSVLFLAIILILASTAGAQEAVRMRGTHEHGHGTLNLAIEGDTVLIELHAPGADILGFEHPARTEDDRKAVEKARTMLHDPLALFAMPAAAGCRVEEVTVALAGDAGHGQYEQEHVQAGQDGHMEFHAEYALHCDRPTAVQRLGFPFFTLFPRSRELAVTIITDRGQTTFEVERDTPALELKPAR